MSKQRSFYREQIDADIEKYIAYLKSSSNTQFGASASPSIDAFTTVLGRGKRLRGTLTMVGYEMCGGTNKEMILQAARAMEMVHASLLIIDDVQDRSELRHGLPTAHITLGKETKDAHLGEALAINAGLLGGYAAQMILSNLDAPAELRANTLSITNRTLITTIHGQSADMLGDTPSETVALWKTAQYSVLNPLHVGMVLAGADCHATDGITPYALELGLAYQIKNDIDGLFETDGEKDPAEDIREGKRTLMTEYALQHASSTDKKFLHAALGNSELTNQDFKKCLKIIKGCGALEYAQTKLTDHKRKALKGLKNCEYQWSGPGEELLASLAS